MYARGGERNFGANSPRGRTNHDTYSPRLVSGRLTSRDEAELAPLHTMHAVAGPVVLVVEDDDGIGGALVRTLSGQRYEVAWAHTGMDALNEVTSSTALVVLDLGLPDIDGLEVCRAIKDRTPAPQVLILTARSEEADIVLGLDAGADDYLTKPFALGEFLARVRACTRRVDQVAERIELGNLVIDTARRVVEIDCSPVPFRPKEFDLLVALARDAGRVVTRDALINDVWDENWFGSTKTLDIHILAVRRKIDPPSGPSRITTLRGVGYRLEDA